MTNYSIGQVLTFKASRPYLSAQYGPTATVTGNRRIITNRKFGIIKTEIEMLSANGMTLVWDLPTMRREFARG